METIVAKEFVGEPVTVSLASGEYRLSYPMQAIILYKQKTAEIDRRRQAGKPRLNAAQLAELREQVQRLVVRSREFAPKAAEAWEPARSDEWDRLLNEASDCRAQLIADAGTGDSLFDLLTWRQLDPVKDPERIVAALWAGLQGEYPQMSYDQVQKSIHLGNGADLTFAIAKALSSYIRKSEVPDPNAPTPAAKTPAIETTILDPPTAK